MAEPLARKHLRLGARGSLLSRMQSRGFADALEAAHPGLTVELVTITTTGDQITDKPLHEFGGKGLFTKELELALLAGEVDFAVHSFKDVPVTMPLVGQEELVIAAVPQRADARDVLVSAAAKRIVDLPKGAQVGTSSLRRQAQILALRPDLQLLPLRGNIDTRLRKLREKQFEAIILAYAGLYRANLFDANWMFPIDVAEILPAAGQGALAVQCRRDNAAVRGLLGVMNHPPTALAVELERAVVLGLTGDCHSPIGAYAKQFGNEEVELRVCVGRKGGGLPVLKAQNNGPIGLLKWVLEDVIGQLESRGVHAHLHG